MTAPRKLNDIVYAKSSGKPYVIKVIYPNADDPEYGVIGLRDGKPFGASRRLRESAIKQPTN